MRLRPAQALERTLKYLWRSKSLDLALHWNDRPPRVRSFRFHGHPFYYRTGTDDLSALNEVLFRTGANAEYHFPIEGEPRVLLDIGGHIGSASLYFAHRFPECRIFAFEPAPDNFELLVKNTAPYPNIRAFNFGLGGSSGSVALTGSAGAHDTGGRTIVPDSGLGGPLSSIVQIRSAAETLAELGIAEVDYIKIDTEGAEHDILTGFPQEILKNVRWIIGELHDVRDFELLAFLNTWFHVGLDKRKVRFRYSCFRAANRAMVACLNSYD